MLQMAKNYLTYKSVVNVVCCLNMIQYKQSSTVILSRKLYNKIVEHDLVDDCCFNFKVSKFFHSPYPYSIEL